MSEEDPLEGLYIDKKEIDRSRLTEVLLKFVGIDKETGDPHLRKPFYSLSAKEKVICFLLYRKAKMLLGRVSEENEGLSSKEISNLTGVKYNTVRGINSRVDLIVKKKVKGGFIIPSVNIIPAMNLLSEEKDE